MALNPRQRRFIEEYLLDLNASAAALRAGYSEKHARFTGSRMLNDEEVVTAIKSAMDARSARTLINQDTVLRQWLALATADPNELVEFRRECCRHCWGPNFAYQHTVIERQAQAAQGKKVADGEPFKATRAPNPKCPECHGEGEARPFFKDTRNLSPAARALYAGVKVTKEGIEIKMNSQEKAWEMVMRHLGGVIEKHKHEHTGPDGQPLPAAPPPVIVYLPSNGRDEGG